MKGGEDNETGADQGETRNTDEDEEEKEEKK
jgi:hypothetical protein